MEFAHVTSKLVDDRAVAVSPVGTEGGVVSPVAVGDGDAVGDADGLAVGLGEGLLDGLVEGLADGLADGLDDGDADGELPGVTRPVMVQVVIHWSGALPCEIWQSPMDGARVMTWRLGAAQAAVPKPTTKAMTPIAAPCSSCRFRETARCLGLVLMVMNPSQHT